MLFAMVAKSEVICKKRCRAGVFLASVFSVAEQRHLPVRELGAYLMHAPRMERDTQKRYHTEHHSGNLYPLR